MGKKHVSEEEPYQVLASFCDRSQILHFCGLRIDLYTSHKENTRGVEMGVHEWAHGIPLIQTAAIIK